jgi:hypothetical protein
MTTMRTEARIAAAVALDKRRTEAKYDALLAARAREIAAQHGLPSDHTTTPQQRARLEELLVADEEFRQLSATAVAAERVPDILVANGWVPEVRGPDEPVRWIQPTSAAGA